MSEECKLDFGQLNCITHRLPVYQERMMCSEGHRQSNLEFARQLLDQDPSEVARSACKNGNLQYTAGKVIFAKEILKLLRLRAEEMGKEKG